MTKKVIIYGSYGYTGQLIVQEIKLLNFDIILAGRDLKKLKNQSEQTGYPFEVVDIENSGALEKLLSQATLVIHCAGPFQHTAKKMILACLKTKTHYTDITGEFPVFELLFQFDSAAKEAGIMIMPGVGFDVVPSDCLAIHLKNRLPSATHLQLAFTSFKGGVSRGTALTSAENLGQGSYVRKNGILVRTSAAANVKQINFGPFNTTTVSIPWGDISTAYRSTAILNIEVFMGIPQKLIRLFKLSNYFSWLFKIKWLKSFIKTQIYNKISGPSVERRLKGRSYFWGKVWDEKGNTCTNLLETIDGYTLTAKTSVLIAEKVLNGKFETGFQTPALAYGPDLILAVDKTIRTDL